MADMKQMYRQNFVRPAEETTCGSYGDFRLPLQLMNTIYLKIRTRGTSAAPFQALLTIRELATVNGGNWPIAASVLLHDTFVDDILTGANSIEAVLECQSQLINLCAMEQFHLRKWASNTNQLLETVAKEDRAMSPSVLLASSEHSDLKVLGLKWDPVADTFSFKVHPSKDNSTKRTVLSDIARVFNPLGLLSPTTFWTKYLMQRLWTSSVSWDDSLTADIEPSWSRYQSELYLIEYILIPRLTYDHMISLQLHAFSDSSEKGYAAAIYHRVKTSTEIHCQLITGKSKVAPLKKTTIPRLKLCGVVYAVKLLNLVKITYTDRLKIDATYAWTDSTTALAWIQSSPHRWATFVANRSSQININLALHPLSRKPSQGTR